MSKRPLPQAARFPAPATLKEMQSYRQHALKDGGTAYSGALSQGLVDRAAEHIAYYPELQAATLRALSDDPHPDLIAAMAEAVLDVTKTPGSSPSEAERLQSIHAVRAALKAAADHVDPKEPPF